MNLLVKTCNYERMNVQRIVARGVVLLGVLVCGVAVLGAFAEMGYTARTPIAYARTAAVPLVIAVVIFRVGLYFEVLAAALLVVGAVGVAIWGVVAGWESGSWVAMAILVMGPMLLSGVLYWLAAQTQMVCSLDEAK
ncbi:MAG: hypothetical protein Q8K99_01870 [Actinomycetota bacterium]|nr:hypothetical protein [Actinomycetota bacterium]